MGNESLLNERGKWGKDVSDNESELGGQRLGHGGEG